MIRELMETVRALRGIQRRLDDLQIQQGRTLAALNRTKPGNSLHDFEFRVFSQWGEDGIIQKLISCVPIAHRTFIEFGVEDFSESNCRFLLMNDNWRGYVIDGSPRNIERLKKAYYYWKHDLTAACGFITRENINALLAKSGFAHDLGILSIDLDGVDYWVFEAINDYRPRILIMEYNAVFGPSRSITVPYDADFQRTRKHYSNLYFGASLRALAFLAAKKGYSLVGTNSAGVNAFFVRNDLVGPPLSAVSVDDAFVDSHAREARDQQGKLTYVSGADRLRLIRGMPVINVESGEAEQI